MKQTVNPYYEPADIEIYVANKGLVLKEKSLIAFCEEGKSVKVLGIGNAVLDLGSTETGATIFSPFHQGMIDNYSMAEKIIFYFVKKSWGRHFKRPVVGLCIPPSYQGICEIGMKAYLDAVYMAGAKQVESIWDADEKLLADAARGDIKTFDMIIRVTKDNPLDYVKEHAKETLQYAASYGVSKEELLAILESMTITEET